MIPATTEVQSAGKLPFFFLISGICCLLFSTLFLFVAVPNLALGSFRTPMVWAWVHLFILGFATMVAMGAMYQLVPVALQVPVYSMKLGYWQFFMFAIGVFGLVTGFFIVHLTTLICFGLLVFLGVITFIYNMLLTMKKMVEHTDISKHVFSSLIYLLLTVVLGLLFVLNMKWGFLGTTQSQLYYTHFLMGLVGWFTLLIFGFSYKMLPMFSLSHGFSEKRPSKILLLTHSGIILSMIGALISSRYTVCVGILLLLVAYVLFMIHSWEIVQKRLKRNLDVGVKAAIVGMGFGCISLFLLLVFTAFYLSANWMMASIFLFVYGWLGLSICGYLYKIIPFLWWTHKYSSKIGKEKVPQLKDLTSEKLGKYLFVLMFVGVLLFCLSIGFQSTLMMWGMVTILFIATLIFTVVNTMVFWK